MTRPGSRSEGAAVRRLIERSHRDYAAAMKRGDAAALASHFADDGALLPEHSNLCRGRPAIEKWFASWLPSTRVREFEISTSELIVAGDTAYETGSHRMVLEPGGSSPVTYEGKFLMVYVRGHDGLGRIARDMFNSNGPEGRTP